MTERDSLKMNETAKEKIDRKRREAEARDVVYNKIPLDERIKRCKLGSKEQKKLLILKGPHS